MKTDSQLQREVVNALISERATNAVAIVVTVANGIVTLDGYLSSVAEKVAAVKAAQCIHGIKGMQFNWRPTRRKPRRQ